MSKIFTWLSGLQIGSLIGFIGGIMLVSLSVVLDPDGMIKICEESKE